MPPEMDLTPKPAEIVRIEALTAGEIFGDKTMAREGETLELAKARPMYRIYFEGVGVVGKTVMGKPKTLHPKSDLARFVRTYKTAPKVGLKVLAIPNSESGFWDLVLGK